MNPLEELKELLTGVSDQQKEVREKIDEQKGYFEEKFGKVEDRLTELENKGIPTVRTPQVMDVTIPEAEGGPKVKKIHFGYDLDIQGKNLFSHMRRPEDKEWLTRLEPHTMIEDEQKREEYAKFLIDVVKARFGDPRAMSRLYEARERAEKTAMAEGAGATGGYLVPEEFTNEILAFARLSSDALRYCRVWPMSSDVRKVPVESTGVTVSWKAEATALGESEPAVGEVELTAKRVGAYAISSNDLLNDSAIDIVSWLTELFAEALGLELDNQVANGTGDPCSGILTAACGYSVVMTETNFSSITGTYLSQMIANLSANKRAGARFFAEKLIVHYIRSLKDSNGQFLFAQIGGNVSQGIWGFPYSENEKWPSTTGTSTAFVSFGDLRYFALGRRLQNMTLAADPYTKFVEDQTRFKIVNRWGMKIGLATAFVRLLTGS